ncbi:SbtR family transcriptional regulator [Streptomyces chartreusis]|uniref:SbtR family transcriptional regulator n=1 Tax=Streptomyces chartreusis TaxID=1969 RepID=UPI00381D2250
MRRKHGLGDAPSSGAQQAITERSYGPVIAAISQLLDAGQQDGSVREDADFGDFGDFLQLTGALWRATSGPEDRSPRMPALILDHLRARP